jgi:hypothetical protein
VSFLVCLRAVPEDVRVMEWYRPRGGGRSAELAEIIVTVAFDGLRMKP